MFLTIHGSVMGYVAAGCWKLTDSNCVKILKTWTLKLLPEMDMSTRMTRFLRPFLEELNYVCYTIIYIYRYVCMNVWMYECMNECMYVCMYVCMYIHTYIYILEIWGHRKWKRTWNGHRMSLISIGENYRSWVPKRDPCQNVCWSSCFPGQVRLNPYFTAP